MHTKNAGRTGHPPASDANRPDIGVDKTLENLSAPTNGVVTNTANINFEESTASWGTITHFVIYDAEIDGNLLMYGALSTPRVVEAATVMTIRQDYLRLSAQNPA